MEYLLRHIVIVVILYREKRQRCLFSNRARYRWTLHTSTLSFNLLARRAGPKRNRRSNQKARISKRLLPPLNYPLKAITSKSDEPNSELTRLHYSSRLNQHTWPRSPSSYPNFLRSEQEMRKLRLSNEALLPRALNGSLTGSLAQFQPLSPHPTHELQLTNRHRAKPVGISSVYRSDFRGSNARPGSMRPLASRYQTEDVPFI